MKSAASLKVCKFIIAILLLLSILIKPDIFRLSGLEQIVTSDLSTVAGMTKKIRFFASLRMTNEGAVQ